MMKSMKPNAFFRKRVGDYELCEVLGEGTFATVSLLVSPWGCE